MCKILRESKYRDCKISREKSLFRCCVVRAYAKTFYSAAKCWEQSRAEQRPRFLALVVHQLQRTHVFFVLVVQLAVLVCTLWVWCGCLHAWMRLCVCLCVPSRPRVGIAQRLCDLAKLLGLVIHSESAHSCLELQLIGAPASLSLTPPANPIIFFRSQSYKDSQRLRII